MRPPPTVTFADEATDRYLSHCEDPPYFKTSRHRTLEEASAVTIQSVTHRLRCNGCGDGLVYDRHDDKIVAIYGHTGTTHPQAGAPVFTVGLVPLPNEATQAQMKTLAIAWDEAIETKDYPESIWQTHSDF